MKTYCASGDHMVEKDQIVIKNKKRKCVNCWKKVTRIPIAKDYAANKLKQLSTPSRSCDDK